MHDICAREVIDDVEHLPYFESIISEGLRHTTKSESSIEPADSDDCQKLKFQCSMYSGDSIMMQRQTGREIDVPRLVYSTFRTRNSSQELQTKLIDVYRRIDEMGSDIITEHKTQTDKERCGIRGFFGRLKAYVV